MVQGAGSEVSVPDERGAARLHGSNPEARVPPDATVDAIDHCLRTIALVNTADDPHAAALVSAEPDVVASWVSFELATRRELRAEASVRKHPGAWVIRFVGRGGGLGYDETLARAFASCMASHEPKLDVEVGKVTGRRLSW